MYQRKIMRVVILRHLGIRNLTVYIRSLCPDAKCNPDEYMTKFRLVRNGKGNFRYNFRCCKKIKIINQKKIYTTNKRNDKSSYCTRTICFISYNYRDSFGCLFLQLKNLKILMNLQQILAHK